MATASSANTAAGTVKVVIGDVKIIGVDGVVRNAVVGEKVYAKEVIQTAANAVVQVQLENGRMLDLGRSAQIALDDIVLAPVGATAATGATGLTIAEIQARIAAGEDPANFTEAAAAGGTPGDTSEGTHDPLLINQANAIGPVTAGYDTKPITQAFEQQQNEALPTLPIVTVSVQVDVPNRPPEAPAGTPNDVPFARTDVDSISRSGFLATGNVLSGAGTTSGTAGADTPGADGARVTGVTSPTGNLAAIDGNGVITINGQYGQLIINPDGSYTYNRFPDSPNGVTETFTYTLTDGTGDEAIANLIIDIGTPEIPGDEPGGDGAVVTVGGALLLEGTHPDAKEITFVLQLDRPSPTPVEVTYEIRPISASTPADFFGVLTATVIIPANTTRVEVPVSIVQDHLVENDETFSIVLTSAVNAVIDPESSSAQITIRDDDLPPDAQDDSYVITRGQPNDLPSVLSRLDGPETLDDTGAGPFETLTVVPGPNDTALPNGDIGITTAQGGTVVMHPDGTFTYIPPANLQGPDTFVYTMTDGFNGTDAATVTLSPANQPPTVTINLTPAQAQVNEAGLAVGSDPASTSETVQGTFTIADPDGIADVIQITINDQVFVPGELVGKTIPTFINNDPAQPLGVLTITSFDPATGVVGFSYELLTPVTDRPNQPEQDLFTVVVTDNAEKDSAPATLTINIIDDLPVARNDADSVAPGTFGPETGNVITGAGTAVPAAGRDTLGADSPTTLTGISSPAGNPTLNPDGSFTIPGQYGVLTIKPNGDYSYTRTPGTPGGVTDTFTYTLTDGDGDPSSATLDINIGDSLVELSLPGSKVNEAGLPARGGEPAGSNEPANSEKTSGAITFTARDGLAAVTLDGTAVTGAGQLIPGAHGTLEVTGFTYDPVTGNGTITYNYVLTDNTAGDTTSDDFDVVVTENDGDLSTGKLTIDIIDDVPAAHDDSDSVPGGSLAPASGNVITGAGTNEGAGGAGTDIPGADNVVLTGIASTNLPGNIPAANADGSFSILGQYGVLTIFPNGEYSYQRNPGTPGGVVDIFRYTLTDSDGDATAANLAINIGNALVELKVEPEQVKEAALPVGSTPLSNEETTTGAITFTARDGLQSVTLDGVTVTGPGQTIAGDHGTLTITSFSHDPVTGLGTVTYTYTLTQPTFGDTTKDEFNVVITENDGDTAATVLTINIIDDVPEARNDADSVPTGSTGTAGNVITGVGTDTGGTGADTPGADTVTLTAIGSTNVPGSVPTTNPDGSFTIPGQFGVLTIFPNGEYSYQRNPGSPGGVVDTFRYTLTDGDGDATAANLAITIGDVSGVIVVPASEVKEEGLPARGLEPEGSKAADNSETTQGAFTFRTVDGLDSVTLDGVVVTGPGQLIPGDHGTLTVTGLSYDPVSGNGSVTYSYTLTDNTAGDSTRDDYAVVVTDKDGDSANGTLTINIIDDVPTARNDTDTLAPGTFGPESGNVITGAGTTSGIPGADTQGADSAQVTGITSTNIPGNTATDVNGVLTIAGQYGVLTINPDGGYTYVRNPNTPGGVDETFRYTLLDDDGDASQANLVISIGNTRVELNVPALGAPGTLVDEAGLPARGAEPAGTNEASDAEKTNGAITFNVKDGQPILSIDGVPVTGAPGQVITGDHGTLTVTGFTHDPVSGVGTITYEYLLTDNTPGDNTVDDFAVTVSDQDGDSSSATLTIAIEDDEPTISVVAAPPNSLQVDESSLNQDATANFGRLFTSVPGADDATVVYSLDVKSPGVDSGLVDVATGQPIVLVKNPATGAIEGHVGNPGGALAFTLTVNAGNGDVTLDQILPIRHPDATNPDDELSLGAADLVSMTGTITDGDGDVRSAVLNLGEAISFKDDGPSISPNNSPLPSLTVDETNLAINASASFAGNFTPLFGADAAGSVAYTLNTAGGNSGLTDVASGQPVVLVKNGDVIEGHVGNAAGAIAFIVSVNPATGEVTLDQQRALTHPNAANPDDAVSLAPGAISLQATVTDRDGDTAQANLNIGNALTFKDDGPSISPNNSPLPSLTVDETNLAINASASFAGNFTPLFGADAAGSVAYTLNTAGGNSGLTDVASGQPVVLVKNGDVIEGHVGNAAGAIAFIVSVNPATGEVTLDQQRALTHPNAANPDDAVSLAPGAISLQATVTDRDGDTAQANLNIGNALTFKDDGPSISPNNSPLPSLTVDETNLAINASASFAGNFTPLFGADAAGSVAYTLNTAGGNSGLTDVASGQPVVLVKNGDVIEGHVGNAAGAIAFIVSVNPATGEVTLDQQRALTHPNAANPDDAVSLAPGAISLQATVTDRDGDTAQANLNIGNALTFKDDGPSISPNNSPLPSLTVDETNLAINASASFAGNFTPLFGADAAGSVAYTLNTAGGNSGLTDVASGQPVVLVKNGDVIEGHVGNAAGAIAFIVSVNPATGEVTLDQQRALTHPNAANPDDAVSLAPGAISLQATVTDRDGDTAQANLNIGNALTFKDDGPSISPNNSPLPSLTVDETNLAINASASFAGNFTPLFGADAAGSVAYTLNTAGGNSGLTDVASGQPVVLVKNGDVIEGHVGNAAGAIAFIVSVNPATGEVTLDQQRALTHPNAANPDDAVSLAPGAISLQATVTDRDGDTAQANLNIGNALTFKDDGPSISPNNSPLPSLTVDETNLAINASASFAGNFTPLFGADAAGSVAYTLNTAGGNSGLTDVASGQPVVLVKNGDVIEGHVGNAAGAIAFIVSVNPATGEVTLDQQRALTHPNAANPDDAVSLAPGAISLQATVTDRDGDTAQANLNIGNALTFKDDGPSISPNNSPLPSLTVDETNLAINASASFAGNFTPLFGADAAGSVAYTLNTAGGNSGLTDVASGQPVVLVKNGDVIEGHVGNAAGAIAFIVSVNPATGEVTLDQQRALTHPNAANPDDAVSLAPGAISLQATVTDRDGDTAQANLNIGNALTFKDDGPKIIAGKVAGAVEEEALPVVGNQDANDIPNTGLVASGSLAGLASFGADGAGTFALDASAVASLTAQGLTSDGVALTYTIVGDTLTARAGAVDVFTLQVTSAGNYTFTLKDQLDHAVVQGENTLDINFGSLIRVTDRDGDSLALGGATGADFSITVQDDVPVAKVATVGGAVDEDGLAGANADAGRAGEVAGTASATVSGAAGALNALVSVGADQPGSFSFGSDLSSLTAQALKSNGVALTYTVSGDTLTAKAGALDVFTLQVNSNGSYSFTLKDQLDHPTLNGLPGDNTENALDINFGGVLKVTDRDGDTLSLGGNTGAEFKITVQDDIPVATNITRSTAADVGAVTNLTLVLDVSGSMSTVVTVDGRSMSRLEAEKLSAKALIDEYSALGPVKVSVVTFSAGSTALGYWLDAAAAKAAIDAIPGPGGTTNYTAGLDLAKLGYDGAAAHNGLLPSAQDVLYFLSDGMPNPANTGLDTAAEVTAWENFLKGTAGSGNVLGEKITAYALGMGPDVAAGALNPIAYNGVSATNTNAIVVSDFSQLTQTLLSTVQIQEVAGNLLTDPNPDASYGADAPGWVQMLNVDGRTYVYDQTTDSTSGTTGTNGVFDTATNKWTITTASGGKLVVDMDDGAYVYTPPANFAGSSVENFGFTLSDRDGDTAGANLRINVEGPSLVVGQNVNDQPGQTTPHKVDPVVGNAGLIGGGGSNDILIGDVGGGSLVGKKTNVILILDTSGSMGETFGKDTASRLQGLKDGVNGMIDSLKTSGATDVRVHINHFSTTVEAGTKGAQTFDLVINGVVQTAQVTAAHNFVNSFTAGGFTNYEAGLQEALTWIDGPNELTGPNVVNQAIFVSDGEPNRALSGDSTSLTSVVNFADTTTGWNQAMNQVLGAPGSGDTVNEVTRMETQFGQMQAIGMGLSADAVARLTLLEGAGGAATNTTNAAEFKNELSNVSPVNALGAVGNDIITGGAGSDLIFGDSVNTDALAVARGLNLPAGSGWQVFETLEAGNTGWTREDTQTYIRTHQDELAAESVGTGGARRTGGNDTIDAGAGNDRVYGQEGNDIITGGAGNDILSGGSGADTFKWNNADKGTGAAPALDTITDFGTATSGSNKDVLDLRDLLQGESAGSLGAYLSFSQTGSDVTLSVHSAGASGPIDQKIVLQGVTMAQLAGSNPADSAGVIANLLTNNKLITD